MAFVGDVVPYERRQQVLGRYLTGQITGQLFGQAAGGIIGDLLGWRAVFFLLSAVFALAAIALFRELAINPSTRPEQRADETSRGFVADYSVVLSNPWARAVLFAAVIEAALMWGAFAYVGADLYLRFGLSFTLIGVIVATFGIGGLIYAALVPRLVGRFGQTGLATFGGLLVGLAYLALAFAPVVVDRARSPWSRSGSASTCCTTRCRPTRRRCRRRRAAPRSRSSPRRSISGSRSASRAARC